MTPIRYLSVAEYNTHLRVPVEIDGNRTVAIINSGATGNFISSTFIRSRGLQTKIKKNLYDL